MYQVGHQGKFRGKGEWCHGSRRANMGEEQGYITPVSKCTVNLMYGGKWMSYTYQNGE